MDAFGRRRSAWLIVALAALAGGCSGDDTERLGRVGRKIGERAEALTPDAADKLVRGWEAVRYSLDDMPVATRVALRLRWENSLAGSQIQVAAEGGVVELTGTVSDMTQHRRAVELAESTAGVEKVTDGLETATP